MAEKFYYKVINNDGKTVAGIIEASNRYEAEMNLIEKGFNVLNVRTANILDELDKKFEELKEKFIPVSLTDLIVFTRQFATLFSAGIPVLTSLERLKEQALNLKLKKVLSIIVEDVRAGSSLFVAFNKHSDVFPPLYIGMIKVGEEGGVLDIILQRIAAILETQLETKNRIKMATRYPKIAIFSIMVAFTILITFVIPKFISLFSKFHAQLPLPTRILIGVNYLFHKFWWAGLILIIAGIIAYNKIKKTEKGKYEIDKAILKFPILGNLLKKIYIGRITRILGLLYQSGIPIITCFEIVSEVTGNEIFREELLKIKELIATGTSINESVKRSFLFPPIVSDMIAAGEETGLLDEMLFKIADYFDEEADYIIKNLSSIIEPILLLFIAGMILILALGVFLPMWNLMHVFKG